MRLIIFEGIYSESEKIFTTIFQYIVAISIT